MTLERRLLVALLSRWCALEHTDATCINSVTQLSRGSLVSLQVCGALFPHVWQDGDLFLHCRLLRPVVNSLAPSYTCMCVCTYMCAGFEHCLKLCIVFFFLLVLFLSRLNLRELGPWTCHMRWLVWVMASFGTTYVFFFHERSVCAHPAVLRTSIASNAKKQQHCVFIVLIISKKNSRNKTHLVLFPASCPAKTAVSFYVPHVCKMMLGGVTNVRQVSCIAC